MKSLLLIACIIGLALAQTPNAPQAAPKPCCGPVQWEGVSVNWDPYEHFRNRAQVSYDGKAQKIRAQFLRVNREVHHLIDVILDYPAKQAYIIDSNRDGTHIYNCATEKLLEEFHLDCVPSTARYETSVTLGAQLQADIWFYDVQGNNRTIKAYEMRTRNGCYFVEGTQRSRHFGVAVHQVWDISLGIKNPSVFTPPSQCVQQSASASAGRVQTSILPVSITSYADLLTAIEN